ncbi:MULTISPECIES: DUF5107 domain-containing protein [unclassified Streptomyces]|uniref:DUF5107 domain-containing protein n=1 Tax=unclassified Streptomyces TaxID=2593676 RepID=UPI00225BF202|nr:MULTISPECIES: DUF5107 domain-containing protein [unclassified Streptomyces]MCX4528912.1 DUF5107 domain-containing protein [Streptomyces sp. NBC_01551]MCX4540417.1 DUF5107 domain-containing protein [Streptomyces sp. NBC_01565]
MATTVRRAVLTLPAAVLGPDNPLPALRAPDGVHVLDERSRAGLPRDMARQIGYEPLRSLLPARVRDGYGRARAERDVDAVVIENEHLRATVLPGLGGRVHSLVHLPTGRELLYRNPVFQPANFALNGAWFSGGIEWNIGATGHTTLSCAPLHAALVPAPDGGAMVRLWEWERLRDLPFQVDLWLPEGSEFLYVGVRVRNPHERPAPVYWWSNTAVPEDSGTRVLAPADEAWHFGYERSLRRIPVPDWEGADRTYPPRSAYPADFFYEVRDGERPWIASLDADGHGLAQTSTARLRGRKLFVWGAGEGGRRWQEWLTEPGTGGYAEIQAGLARTQLEHVRLEGGAEFSWLEAYGPLAADPAAVHGADWPAARGAASVALDAALPRERVDAAYEAWRGSADTEPGERLAAGSGWGALEVLCGGHKLPGTPFEEAGLGPEQAPWLELWRTGVFPTPRRVVPPGPTLVAAHWRDMLETARADPLTEYHLGVAQWHAGDVAQAVRSWERGLALAPSRWPLLRCLALAEAVAGDPERAADGYAEAFADLAEESRGGEAWTAAESALGREAMTALLAAGRPAQARAVWDRLRPALREQGRFRLLAARLLAAEGHVGAARRVFEEGFELPDLREGEEVLAEVWSSLTDRPLPQAYNFRMSPPG